MPIYVPTEEAKVTALLEKAELDTASFEAHDNDTFSITVKADNRVKAGRKIEEMGTFIALHSVKATSDEQDEWIVRFGFVLSFLG